jgi:hypothetical protein
MIPHTSHPVWNALISDPHFNDGMIAFEQIENLQKYLGAVIHHTATPTAIMKAKATVLRAFQADGVEGISPEMIQWADRLAEDPRAAAAHVYGPYGLRNHTLMQSQKGTLLIGELIVKQPMMLIIVTNS